MSAIIFSRAKVLLAVFLLFSVFSTALVAGPTALTNNVAHAVEDGEPGDGEGVQTAADSCEENGGAFSFAACPLLDLFNEGVQQFDTEVRKSLQIDTRYYKDFESGTGTNEAPLRNVWASLRNLAYILLIPVMLMLVIGTALGVSVLDAYTVRRAMPRLLIAVIFIAVSYDVGAFLIDLSNAASRGIQGILVSAVGQDELNLHQLFGGGEEGVLVAGALGGGILAGISFAVGALSIGILASFLGTAALALLIIFFILLIRQLITVIALIALPLAILTWIFPGQDKPWKFVWGIFTAMLWAGPAFAAFVIMGRIAAFVINEATGGAAEPGLFDAVLILVTKLFLIIGSMVGGLFILNILFSSVGNLTGIINDRSRGLFDRNRNFRQGKRKQKMEDAARGARFAGKSRTTDYFNRRSAGLRNMPKNFSEGGITANPRTLLARQRQSRSDNVLQQQAAMRQDDSFAALKGNDTALKALAEASQQNMSNAQRRNYVADAMGFDMNNSQDMKNLDQTLAQADVMQRKYGKQAFEIGAIAQSAAGGTAFGRDQNEAEVFNALQRSMSQTTGGELDQNLAQNLVGSIRGEMVQAGRIDSGGAGHGHTAGILARLHAGDIDEQQASEELRRFVYEGNSAQALTHQGNKPYAVQNQTLEMRRRLGEAHQGLEDAMATGDEQMIAGAQAHLDRTQAEISNVYNALPFSSAQNANRVGDLVMDWDPESYDPNAIQRYHMPDARGPAGSHIDPVRNRPGAAPGYYGDQTRADGTRAIPTRQRLEGYTTDEHTGQRLTSAEIDASRAADREAARRRQRGEHGPVPGQRALQGVTGSRESATHRTTVREHGIDSENPIAAEQQRRTMEAGGTYDPSGRPPGVGG